MAAFNWSRENYIYELLLVVFRVKKKCRIPLHSLIFIRILPSVYLRIVYVVVFRDLHFGCRLWKYFKRSNYGTCFSKTHLRF